MKKSNNEYVPIKLNRVIKNLNKPLLFISLFLFVVGTLNIVNTSSFEVTNNGHIYGYFLKQVGYLGIGTIISLFFLLFSTKIYKIRLFNTHAKAFNIIYLIILALVVGCFLMPDVRGAKIRFFLPGGFGFQPSEFAKPVIIVSLAILFEEWSNRIKNRRKTNWWVELFKFAFIGLLIPFMVFLQKDLGTASIIAGISLVMFLYSEFPKKYKSIIEALLVIGVIIVAGAFTLDVKYNIGILSEAQKSRLTGFFTPCDHYTTTGYQVCNAFIAMNQGGLTGLGIGNSKQKYTYLVEPHTDSVFAIIAEECGVIVTTGILILLFSVVFVLYGMSKRIKDQFGKYVCFGMSWYLFIHLFFNLGGLLGIIPLTGVPLPFFSYGGTFALCLLCSLSFAQRVWVEDKTKVIKI